MSETNQDKPTYFSLYVVGPKDASPYKDEILNKIHRIITKSEVDKSRISLYYNADETSLGEIIEAYAKEHGYYTKGHIADFKKHARHAYAKRNKKALNLASHILMVVANNTPTITQTNLENDIEDCMKFLLKLNIHVGENKDGEK